MEVQAITPRGYCKGVVRAIDMARKARNAKQPVVILGMIVHNQYIVDALEKMGIRTVDHPDRTRLELLDEIEEGTVIITAHGAGEQVFAKAREKGLHVIDASCLDVIKTHDLIRARLRDGFEILYIGKKGHPEAEGAVSIDEEKVHLISGREDFGTLDPNKRYVITNQTTMSLYDVQDLCDYARQTARARDGGEGDMRGHKGAPGGYPSHGPGCGCRFYRRGSTFQQYEEAGIHRQRREGSPHDREPGRPGCFCFAGEEEGCRLLRSIHAALPDGSGDRFP